MMIFSIVSTKGGTGKTTTTANLGGLLADMGMRVLMVDADTQPSLSKYYAYRKRATKGLSQVIMSGSITEDCVSSVFLRPTNSTLTRLPGCLPRGALDIVTSDDPEGSLQQWMGARIDRGTRLKTPLRTPWVAERYDVVLIDTQGAVGNLQDAAVLAADCLISPVVPDILNSREFIDGTQALLDRLEPSANIGLAVPPLKAVIYRTEHTNDSRSFSALIRDQYLVLRGRVTVLETAVPDLVAFKGAATNQIPVHWMDPLRAGDTLHRLCWELIPNLQGIRTSDIEDEASSVAEVTP